MDSSADQPGSEIVEPSHTPSTTAGEAVNAAAARGEETHTSESVKAEAAKEISKEVSQPVKAEAAKNNGQESAKELTKTAPTNSAPGSALITLVPSAERFDPRRDAPGADHAAPHWRKSALLLHGSRAALVVFLLGCGYLASGQFFHADPSAKPEHVAKAPASAPTPESAERAEFRRVTQEMAEEIHSLKASLASLRSSVAQSQNADDIRSLKKGLDGAKSGLEASKAETNASIAQLTAKFEHLQREQAAKLQQALEKAEHAEQRVNSAPLTTASIPAATQIATANPALAAKLQSQAPSPPAQMQVNAVDPQKKTQQPIANWVVRDVYDGIALVEGPGGAFEVMQGENIPGVGMVKSIERRSNGWIVVTNRGLVEYARD
jgi:ribosomal protein L29